MSDPKCLDIGGHQIALYQSGDIQWGVSWILPRKGAEFQTSLEQLLRDCYEAGMNDAREAMREALGIQE